MSNSATQSPFRLNRARISESAPVAPKSNGGSVAVKETNGGHAAKKDALPRPVLSEELRALKSAELKISSAEPVRPEPARPVREPAPPTRIETLLSLHHPIAEHALGALRNRRTPSEQFRAHCQRVLMLLVIEATRSLPIRQRGPGPDAGGRTLGKPVVVLSLSRDGLGLAHQMAECIPEAVTGVITMHGTETDRPEPRLHLVRAPALSEARVILFTPIIATGLSSCLSITLLRHSGATDVCVLTLVTSTEGAARIQSSHPGTEIWTGAVDNGWDPKIGPAPGIGNFAERLYG